VEAVIVDCRAWCNRRAAGVSIGILLLLHPLLLMGASPLTVPGDLDESLPDGASYARCQNDRQAHSKFSRDTLPMQLVFQLRASPLRGARFMFPAHQVVESVCM